MSELSCSGALETVDQSTCDKTPDKEMDEVDDIVSCWVIVSCTLCCPRKLQEATVATPKTRERLGKEGTSSWRRDGT